MNCSSCKRHPLKRQGVIDVQQLKETTEQYVTFEVGGETYGVCIDCVQEIIRVPGMIKVPRTPLYLEGLTNLRGNILPVIDTRVRFGLEKNQLSETSRVLVLNDGIKKLGFIVDRVSEVTYVNAAEIERVNEQEANANFLKGIARLAGGEQLLMIVDVSRLMQTEGKEDSTTAAAETAGENRTQKQKREVEKEAEIQMVSFKLQAEEYGLELGAVQEIVHVPPSINRVPNSPDYLLGIMTLRNHVLPIFSLRRFFNLENKELDDRSRIVVINLERQQQRRLNVGLVVDSVSEVLRVPQKTVEPVPFLLRSAGGKEISGVCKLAGGKRLVYILDTGSFAAFDNALDIDLIAECGAEHEQEKVNFRDEEEQLVVFKLGDGEFAAGIAQVREIIRVPNIVAVPKAPKFVEGVINLRGTIIPITDLRKRLGMEARPRDEYTRIIVVEINGHLTGLVVDSVKEVLKLSCSNIEAAPEYITKTVEAGFIRGIAKGETEKRLIVVLNMEEIFSFKEKEELINLGQPEVEDETNTGAGC